MSEREPLPDELRAMAYVDGELAPGDRAEFEERLERDAALVREVAAQQRLAVLARACAPREPADHEWARHAASLSQRVGLRTAGILIGLGAAGLAGWCAWEVCRSGIGILPKLLTGAVVAGFLLLFALTLRTRRRLRPFDPYDEIER